MLTQCSANLTSLKAGLTLIPETISNSGIVIRSDTVLNKFSLKYARIQKVLSEGVQP